MLPTPFIQANTDGRLHSAAEASIPPLNRGFLYGDAIYEVWRTYGKVLFAWEEHWARLERSAAALYFPPLPAAATILAEIRRTAGAYRKVTGYGDELYIRLQLARGEGAIGLDPALADAVHFVILVQPCPKLTEVQLEQGQILAVAKNLRRNPAETLNPAWKTGNYLNNLLCLREAKLRGADEAVILNQAGEITEAAVCNLGFVHEGGVLTPPLSAGILAGVTRGFLLAEIAARAGVPIKEAAKHDIQTTAKVVHSKNASCMTCYGSEERPDQCCNTCDEVQRLGRAPAWEGGCRRRDIGGGKALWHWL